MIIEARHNFVLYPFFTWYGSRQVKKCFNNIYWDVSVGENTNSVLIVANHFSWWDGFFVQGFNKKYLGKKFYFMMLQHNLKEHWFFRYTGGFSVDRGKRSVLESLAYATAILKKSDNCLMMFPQGKIQSLHCNYFRFEKGADLIVRRSSNDMHVVFMANIIDYFSFKKPSLYVYAKRIDQNIIASEGLEKQYNIFYAECIEKQILIEN